MFCSKCGTQVNDGLSFCPNCGTPVSNTAAQQPQYAAQPVTLQEPITLTQAEPLRENGFAIAGMFLSLASVVAVGFKTTGLIFTLTALTFSIIGLCRKHSKRRGMAIAGTIISGCLLIAACGITFTT